MADLQYPRSLKGADDPAWIQFQFFDRKRPDLSVIDDRVSLYMPEQFVNPSTVSWDAEKMGLLVGSMTQETPNHAPVHEPGFWNAVGRTLNMGGHRVAASAGSYLSQMIGGNNLDADALMGAYTGKVRNPYLTMIFRGVDFRNFAFTFKFYPFDEADCDIIEEIIRTFRKNALPDFAEGVSMLGYPKECMISYMWRDAENPWLHKFKRAVCTGIDVDYTASGMFSVMRNGFPSEIVMSTKWSEVEIVTRKDVEEDGF